MVTRFRMTENMSTHSRKYPNAFSRLFYDRNLLYIMHVSKHDRNMCAYECKYTNVVTRVSYDPKYVYTGM